MDNKQNTFNIVDHEPTEIKSDYQPIEINDTKELKIKDDLFYYKLNLANYLSNPDKKINTSEIQKQLSMKEKFFEISKEHSICDYIEEGVELCVLVDNSFSTIENNKKYIKSALFDIIRDLELNIFSIKDLNINILNKIRLSYINYSSEEEDCKFKEYTNLNKILDNIDNLIIPSKNKDLSITDLSDKLLSLDWEDDSLKFVIHFCGIDLKPASNYEDMSNALESVGEKDLNYTIVKLNKDNKLKKMLSSFMSINECIPKYNLNS